MFCPNCGKQTPDDSKFCESCGSILGGTAAPAQAAPPIAPAYNPPPAQPVYVQPQQQYYQQQPAYQAPVATAKPMTIGEYIITFIITAIPIVGFILLLVWSFGSDVNPNKKNLCRALLIMMIIGVVLSIIFSGLMVGLITSLINSGDYNFNY